MRMAMKKKICLKDIARKAGVSITTVSAVHNDNPGISVSEDTRNHIKKILAEVNYTRRRSLSYSGAKTKPLSIRVLTQFPANVRMRAEILTGIEERLLRDNGKMLVSESSKAEELMLSDPLSFLKDIDGVIFISRAKDELIKTLGACEVPFVVIGTADVRDDVNMVYPQYFEYVPKAMSYLKGLGHENISLITGPLPHYCHEKSILLFKELACKNGCANPESHVFAMNSECDIYSIVSKIFKSKEHFTALIGQIAPYKGLFESHGFKVPRDISLLSFDIGGEPDNEMSFFGADNSNLGHEGVELIASLRLNPSVQPKHISLPLLFHDNSSCGEI